LIARLFGKVGKKHMGLQGKYIGFLGDQKLDAIPLQLNYSPPLGLDYTISRYGY
jgi:hypothetical protein